MKLIEIPRKSIYEKLFYVVEWKLKKFLTDVESPDLDIPTIKYITREVFDELKFSRMYNGIVFNERIHQK